jgi:hypothetical protein
VKWLVKVNTKVQKPAQCLLAPRKASWCQRESHRFVALQWIHGESKLRLYVFLAVHFRASAMMRRPY